MRAREQTGEDLTYGMVLRRASGHPGLDPFYTGLLEGLEEALEARDAHVVVHLVDAGREERDTYRRWSTTGIVDRVVLTDLVVDDERPGLCASLGLDVVQLGGRITEGKTIIDVDNRGAMQLAVDHLLSLGHRNLARVAGPADLVHTQLRAEAFTTANPEIEMLTIQGDYSHASGEACTRAILTANPQVTAIVFDNDVMAVAALAVARELGRTVPDDLSILAWDDSPECQLAQPPLSVVYRDVRRLGALVGDVLTTASAHARVVRMTDAHIVQRGSTGRVPRAS